MSEVSNNFSESESFESSATAAGRRSVESDLARTEIDDQEENEKVPEAVLSIDPVKDYLKQVGREPLLSAVQEVDLSKAIEVGLLARERYDSVVDDPSATAIDLRELRELEHIGNKAKERMITANLRLVVSLAKRYSTKGLPFLDLIQEGNIGMLRAIETFDFEEGFKFSTYATWWIRQAITRAIADKSREIRLPVYLHVDINKSFKQRRELLLELGRDPTDEEVAVDSGRTLENLKQLQQYDRVPFSLSVKIGQEEDKEYGDLIADDKFESPEAAVDKLGFQQRIAELLGGISENESSVLRQRFGIVTGEPSTRQEIAQNMGMTVEQVSQIEKRVLAKFRDTPGLLEELRHYL